MKALLKKHLTVRLMSSIFICTIVLGIQLAVKSHFPGRFIFIFPVLFFISWIAGFSVSVISTLYCAILSHYLFFQSPAPNMAEVARLGTFIFSNILIAWLIDFTRKREEKLKEDLAFSEKRFRDLADSMPQIVFISRFDGEPEYLNKQWHEYTGIHKIENIIPNWASAIHPDFINRVIRNFSHHLNSGTPWEDVFPIQRHDGQYRWFLARATPIQGENQKIERWFGTTTDIDEQIQIEAQLSESQFHFKQLANSIPHIVWTSTADGVFDFYNARFYEYTGTNKFGPVLQGWDSFIHPDDYKKTVECWNHSLLTSKPYQIEHRLKDISNGNYRWFLGLALPVKDSRGQIVKWFGSCTDIDEQKKLSAKIEGQKTALEKALYAREEFLSIASHELKTPLTSLKLHTQSFNRAVKRGLPDAYSPVRIDSLAFQVEKQVSKLNRLVDDMLDISRIQTGKLTLKPKEFNFSELISEVQEILRSQFISSNCPEPLIENNCENIIVKWDKIRIEQVLINLFTNAIRYGEGKQVTLSTFVKNQNIHIALKDQGIGIAEENLSKIFNRFEKIENPSEVSGLGLGLFISKQIIDAHNGRLSVESKLGVGSVFKIELPY